MAMSIYTPIRDRLLRVVGIDPCAPPTNDPVKAAFVRVVSRYDAPIFALHAPAAQQTWEINARLLSTEEETPRVPIKFPSAALIVGFHASVQFAVFDPDPAANPDTDDVTCLMDVNDGTLKLTSQQALGTASGKGFVTLKALTLQIARLNMIMLDGGNPEIAFTFRSKFATPGASGFGAEVMIDLALFITPIGF